MFLQNKSLYYLSRTHRSLTSFIFLSPHKIHSLSCSKKKKNPQSVNIPSCIRKRLDSFWPIRTHLFHSGIVWIYLMHHWYSVWFSNRNKLSLSVCSLWLDAVLMKKIEQVFAWSEMKEWCLTAFLFFKLPVMAVQTVMQCVWKKKEKEIRCILRF